MEQLESHLYIYTFALRKYDFRGQLQKLGGGQRELRGELH